uniref:Uncharacterized protein n=2 Tax=Sipha flava TaxID=143950 RepID=A0A2S2R6K2_9HEMI
MADRARAGSTREGKSGRYRTQSHKCDALRHAWRREKNSSTGPRAGRVGARREIRPVPNAIAQVRCATARVEKGKKNKSARPSRRQQPPPSSRVSRALWGSCPTDKTNPRGKGQS